MQTAVDWLIEQLQAPCRGIPSHIIEQAKQMENQQKIDILMDIDLDLALIEDYAKGEVGNDITKLRINISELLKQK